VPGAGGVRVMLNKKERWLKIAGKEPETLNELFYSTIDVLNHELKLAALNSSRNKKEKSIPRVLGLKCNLSYFGLVSNSHYCPQNGTTNWGWNNRKTDVRGYPGFAGRVWVRLSNDVGGSYHSFGNTLTYPGTGGSGSYDGPWENINHHFYYSKNKEPINELNIYSWDYIFFISDFPLIEKKIEIKKTVDLLSNKLTKIYSTECWEDPNQLLIDQEFIQSVKEKWNGYEK